MFHQQRVQTFESVGGSTPIQERRLGQRWQRGGGIGRILAAVGKKQLTALRAPSRRKYLQRGCGDSLRSSASMSGDLGRSTRSREGRARDGVDVDTRLRSK